MAFYVEGAFICQEKYHGEKKEVLKSAQARIRRFGFHSGFGFGQMFLFMPDVVTGMGRTTGHAGLQNSTFEVEKLLKICNCMYISSDDTNTSDTTSVGEGSR